MQVNQKGRVTRMDKNRKGTSNAVSNEVDSDTHSYKLNLLSDNEIDNSIYNLLFKKLDVENIKNDTDNSRD